MQLANTIWPLEGSRSQAFSSFVLPLLPAAQLRHGCYSCLFPMAGKLNTNRQDYPLKKILEEDCLFLDREVKEELEFAMKAGSAEEKGFSFVEGGCKYTYIIYVVARWFLQIQVCVSVSNDSPSRPLAYIASWAVCKAVQSCAKLCKPRFCKVLQSARTIHSRIQ